MNEPYNVKLETFEGPLDLLLHLINQFEIDIYDIPVAEITDQYLHYIHTMQQIELNIASEYLVMAATLIEMKSAMLLPKKEMDFEEGQDEEDPREQLIARLIEYRKYKTAAEQLQEKELEENQIFTRAPMQFPDQKIEQPLVQGEVSLFDMLHALDELFKRKSWQAPLETTVNRMEISIEDRMAEILDRLLNTKKEVRFDALFPLPNKHHIVTTFLALLQLLKENKIQCMQDAQFQPIFVRKLEV